MEYKRCKVGVGGGANGFRCGGRRRVGEEKGGGGERLGMVGEGERVRGTVLSSSSPTSPNLLLFLATP